MAAMVRNQKIHIDANPAVACIRRDRPSRSHSSARKRRLLLFVGQPRESAGECVGDSEVHVLVDR
jgi:hypothetical protein